MAREAAHHVSDTIMPKPPGERAIMSPTGAPAQPEHGMTTE